MPETRAAEAVRVARELLEAKGEAALSMRRLAAAMGIRAPSLYKHVPDKAALEVALIAAGLAEAGARDGGRARVHLAGLARAYREWALCPPPAPLPAHDRAPPPPRPAAPGPGGRGRLAARRAHRRRASG